MTKLPFAMLVGTFMIFSVYLFMLQSLMNVAFSYDKIALENNCDVCIVCCYYSCVVFSVIHSIQILDSLVYSKEQYKENTNFCINTVPID